MTTYWQWNTLELASFKRIKGAQHVGIWNIHTAGIQSGLIHDYSPRFPWKQITREQYQYRLKKMKGLNKCGMK